MQDSHILPITPEELQDQCPEVDLDQLFGPPRTHTTAGHQRKDYVNRTGYRGVTRRKHGWSAAVFYHNRGVYLGLFDTPEKAALAYNEAAKKIYGTNARLNEVADETVAKVSKM